MSFWKRVKTPPDDGGGLDLDAVVAERGVALGNDRDLIRDQAGFPWCLDRVAPAPFNRNASDPYSGLDRGGALLSARSRR